jgi:hypothetical protein
VAPHVCGGREPRAEQTLARIAAPFGDAVETEEFERAAGWFAVARWHVGQGHDLDASGRHTLREADRF